MAGYLGDKKTMIVHHLGNKQKECNIYPLEKIHRQYFTPDLLENAISWDLNRVNGVIEKSTVYFPNHRTLGFFALVHCE